MTAEEKKKIAEEEHYRYEVRKGLEGKKQKESGLWKFLNSSFGLFLLSTVVVSGFTAIYTQVQESGKQLRERREKVRRLDSEISNRLAQAVRYLDLERVKVKTADYASDAYPERRYAFAIAANYVDNDFPSDGRTTKQYNFSLYPEMSKLSYRTLLTELAGELTQTGVDSIKRSLLAYEDLLDNGTYYGARGASDSAAYMKGLNEAKGLMSERMLLSRWHFLTPLRRELLR